MPDTVFRLIYRSHDRLPAKTRKEQLGELFSVARSKNKQRDVTGALLITDDFFVQTLEGDETVVRELFDRIRRDGRHDHVTIVEEGFADARVFGRWSMARVSENDEPDVNLIAHSDGTAAAARRGDETPEQDDMLRRMRDTAREATIR